jgi:glucokinase
MSNCYASIDLGGTNVSAALAGPDGVVVAEAKQSTQSHEGPQAVLDRIATMVNELASKSGFRPAALGMGVPGLADLSRGMTKFLPNLPTQWRDVPVRDILSPKVGCPVHLLNDVRMATLGELTYGHGREIKTMVFFALGTGIGGGVVVDGKLRLGPLGAAAELGHMTILPDGPLCGCGNVGCMETLASGPAITAEGVRLLLSGLAPKLFHIVDGNISAVTPATMAAAARAGDASVQFAIERAAGFLAIGAANVITALHPELVVIGGGVSEMGDLLLEPLRAFVRKRVRMVPTEDLRIERSLLGNKAGMLGGVALAVKGGLAPD